VFSLFQKNWSNFIVKQKINSSNVQVNFADQTAKIFSIKTKKMMSLDGVAFDTWILIKDEISFEKIILELLITYEVDKKTLIKDINQFLSQLSKQDLIYYKNQQTVPKI